MFANVIQYGRSYQRMSHFYCLCNVFGKENSVWLVRIYIRMCTVPVIPVECV